MHVNALKDLLIELHETEMIRETDDFVIGFTSDDVHEAISDHLLDSELSWDLLLGEELIGLNYYDNDVNYYVLTPKALKAVNGGKHSSFFQDRGNVK